MPHLVSFSGNKGYHADLFVRESNAQQLATAGRLLSRLLRQVDVHFDEVFPTGSGLTGRTPGGSNVKLPMGQHGKTEKFCYYLDETLCPVPDVLSLLGSLEPIDVQELTERLAHSVGTDLKAGKLTEPWDSRYPWLLHGYRRCVNVLWQEGLQAPSTRNSATMVITNAVLLSRDIPDELKEQAVVDWARRIYQMTRQKAYFHAGTSPEFVESEARRLYEREAENASFGVTCRNPILRPAMESACRDEVGCHLKRSPGRDGFALLTRLGVFNPRNSRKKGIAKSSGYVYLAMQELAEEFGDRHFEYQTMPAFAAPLSMVMELSSCSRTTVKKALKALKAVGLLVKVPKEDVPQEFRRKRLPGQKFILQASYYVLPRLTEELLREVVASAREYRRRM